MKSTSREGLTIDNRRSGRDLGRGITDIWQSFAVEQRLPARFQGLSRHSAELPFEPSDRPARVVSAMDWGRKYGFLALFGKAVRCQ